MTRCHDPIARAAISCDVAPAPLSSSMRSAMRRAASRSRLMSGWRSGCRLQRSDVIPEECVHCRGRAIDVFRDVVERDVACAFDLDELLGLGGMVDELLGQCPGFRTADGRIHRIRPDVWRDNQREISHPFCRAIPKRRARARPCVPRPASATIWDGGRAVEGRGAVVGRGHGCCVAVVARAFRYRVQFAK